MLYPVTANALWIETDNIISMTFSTLTIVMTDASTHVVTNAQFFDIIGIVNKEDQN
jgi:hypothetical protein